MNDKHLFTLDVVSSIDDDIIAVRIQRILVIEHDLGNDDIVDENLEQSAISEEESMLIWQGDGVTIISIGREISVVGFIDDRTTLAEIKGMTATGRRIIRSRTFGALRTRVIELPGPDDVRPCLGDAQRILIRH